jgi:imidazolonepropionase-like amidohydrolase
MTDLVLHGGTVIDGTGSLPFTAAVAVSGERIAGLDAATAPVAAEGAALVDVSGLTLLPGLIDAHTHMGTVAWADQFRIPLAVQAATVFGIAAATLDAGFTTVRDLGGVDGGLVQAIDAGLTRGPRVLPSGALLCQSGGHGDRSRFRPGGTEDAVRVNAPGLVQSPVVCDGPEAVRRAARLQFRFGASQIKMCASGGVLSLADRLEDTQFSVEELRAAVGEASARDSYVTVHAHNTAAILAGLEAGVRCFEHGTFLDSATAARMADAGACLVPTLSVTQVLAEQWETWGVPRSILPRLENVRESSENAVRLAAEAGVLIGSGSDFLGPVQAGRGLEIAAKAAVFGPMAAIVSATSANARVVGLADEIGALRPGLRADIVGLASDPLQHPGRLADDTNVVLVVKDGVIVKDTRMPARQPEKMP